MEVVSQHPHAQDAPTHDVQTPAGAGTVSGPTELMPPRVAQPWGQESLDYAQSKGDAQRRSAEADCGAALDPDLWLPQTSDVEQLTMKVRTRWVLMDIHHIMNGTRTMADVIFIHREVRHSPPPTMDHPSQWRYVATRLMAHLGAYTPDDLDLLHWPWHHRAALRIREAPIQHNIWTIRTPRCRGPPGPDRATEHQRQRFPTTQGPLRQVACTSHSESPHRQRPDVAPPCSPQRSPTGGSPTPGQTTVINAPRIKKSDNTPLRHRGCRGGPGGRRAADARAERRPQQRDG